ncbi:ATP dependent DNA ligase [Rhizobium lentis]|uniref:ATP dependent DNA ligase n=1 Tax=Rhizobium lentis TaxID=1138194 RepID=UPI0035C8F65E
MHGRLGRLLFTGRKDNDWVHVGSFGTGFSRKEVEDLRKVLDSLITKKPVVLLASSALRFRCSLNKPRGICSV